MDRKRTATGQRAAPRADLHKTQAQPQTSEGAKAPLSDKPSDDPLFATWERMLDLRKKHQPKRRALKLTGTRKRALRARLKDHGEGEALRVVEWWLLSDHSTAVWLRSEGYDLDTLIRPANFDRYLGLAHADKHRTHNPKANGRAQHKSMRELLEDAREARQPKPPEAEVVVVDFTPTKEGEHHG